VNRNLTFAEFTQILNNEKIEFELKKENLPDALEFIKLRNGVTIDFSDEITSWIQNENEDDWEMKITKIQNKKDFILNGIRLFRY
jgi:hypothetical protein